MDNKIKKIFLGLFIASNLLVDIIDAEARGRVRLRSSGVHHGANNSGVVMTRNELRACQAYEKRLNAKLTEVERLAGEVKERATAINLLEVKIAERKVTVDTYNEKSVNNFNSLIAEHKNLTEKYNTWIPIYKSEVDKYKNSEDGFNKNCANKEYYLDDMDAVRAEK